MSFTRKVIISQRRLTHYRVPLFQLLRDELFSRNIRLELLVGRGTPAELEKCDSGFLDWAKDISTYYLAGGRICLQPIHRHLNGAELVVVTQENALFANHLLINRPRKFKLAFWGHGANLQTKNPYGFKERYKRWTTKRVDWWFAYTKMSSDLIASTGFPSNCITVLNNSIDTIEQGLYRDSVTASDVLALRQTLGLGEGPVGIYIGSLYADKRLEFLFYAAEAIRQRVPDFCLLIVGDGPERDKVRNWCSGHQWASWLGPLFGQEKAKCLSLAQVMLNPGLVGLGILDSFLFKTPMLTTDCGIHSPEIAYLKNMNNGIITKNTLSDYVAAATSLLVDPKALHALSEGCRNSAKEYTLENMVAKFADGIELAIGPEARNFQD